MSGPDPGWSAIARLEGRVCDELAAWAAEVAAEVREALLFDVDEDLRGLANDLDRRRLALLAQDRDRDPVALTLAGRVDQLERLSNRLEQEIKDDREMAREIRAMLG